MSTSRPAGESRRRLRATFVPQPSWKLLDHIATGQAWHMSASPAAETGPRETAPASRPAGLFARLRAAFRRWNTARHGMQEVERLTRREREDAGLPAVRLSQVDGLVSGRCPDLAVYATRPINDPWNDGRHRAC